MSTLSVANIQSQSTAPPTVKNSAGTEIGTFCRAWCKFDGTSANITSTMTSFNVSSITDNGVGSYGINFATSFPDTNYAATFIGRGVAGNNNTPIPSIHSGLSSNNYTDVAPTTSSCNVAVIIRSGGAVDPAFVHMAFFR
jgi:hypothetical protein